MTPSEQRRLIVTVGGAAVVLIIAVAAAVLMTRSGPSAPAGQTATASGGLQVELGKQGKADPNAPLRCFVNGQYVGMETTAACAAKNGVAPGAMDVGVDQTGAPAVAPVGEAGLQPPASAPVQQSAQPPPAAQVAQNDAVSTTPPAAPAPAPAPSPNATECQRVTGSGLRSEGAMSLGACVRTLFQGRCLEPGESIDGRWGGQTLRLQPGQVTISRDGRSFRPLAPQDEDCNFPPG